MFDIESYLENEYSNKSENSEVTDARNLAEMVQKIYLGVDKVITTEEARIILNEAGADLEPSKEIKPTEVANNA
jgi:hypothetical protein